MAIQGIYFQLPLATLYSLQNTYATCLSQITTVGSSYTIGNRTYTLADMGEVNQSLQEIGIAILRAQGRRPKTVQAVQCYRAPVNPAQGY
jgi:sorbitol-specific phosphotransferase system component IIA